MPKKQVTRRKKKFVGLLSNHADRRDDDIIEVRAWDKAEAEKLMAAEMDTTRFSLRAVLTAKEARSNWA